MSSPPNTAINEIKGKIKSWNEKIGIIPRIIIVVLIAIVLNIFIGTFIYVNSNLEQYRLQIFMYYTWIVVLCLFFVILPNKFDPIFKEKPTVSAESTPTGMDQIVIYLNNQRSSPVAAPQITQTQTPTIPTTQTTQTTPTAQTTQTPTTQTSDPKIN